MKGWIAALFALSVVMTASGQQAGLSKEDQARTEMWFACANSYVGAALSPLTTDDLLVAGARRTCGAQWIGTPEQEELFYRRIIAIRRGNADPLPIDPVRMPSFLVGVWAGECSNPAAGVRIDSAGKITELGAKWACQISKIEEMAPHFMSKGPGWEFTARCDRVMVTGVPQHRVEGYMSLEYPPLDKAGNLLLRVLLKRPATAEDKGIWAIDPTTPLGWYPRCFQ